MNYQEFSEKLRDIDRTKEFLNFLALRIKQKEYRGIHYTQHNRYTFDDVELMLSEFTGFLPQTIDKEPLKTLKYS